MTAGPNPWLERRVLAYAHQGGAKEGPSSTLAAIGAALAAGATAVELDVHASVDGHLVVCHDPTVDRTCDASGAIASMTLDELRRLDNAHWWVPGSVVEHDEAVPPSDYVHRGRAPADPSFGIATVDEVLDACPDVPLNFDIKQTAPAVTPYEELLADTLRRHGRADDVIVASFIDDATDRFSAYAPEIPVSLGTNGTAEFYRSVRAGERPPVGRHVALQVPHRFGDVTLVDAEFVEVAHDVGLAVHVWTIDDPDEMRVLLDAGVDGIISDVPSVLARVLDERGAGWPGGGGRP